MMLLVFTIIAFLISLALGGKFKYLLQIHFRQSFLVLISMALQILVFSTWWQSRPDEASWGLFLYAVSLLLLVLFIIVNFKILGFPLIALGLLLNASVILANGGYMPASLEALQRAGIASDTQAYAAARATNSALITEGTRLWYLGDIFAFPKSWPLPNVFSIGDVYITAGAIWFAWASLHPKEG